MPNEQTAAGSGKRGRARVTNNPLRTRADSRSTNGRRVRDLFKAHMARLGNPDDVVAQASVLAAAEIQVTAENIRAKVLAGDLTLAESLIRIESLADRMVRRLSRFKCNDKPKTLQDHLARRNGMAP